MFLWPVIVGKLDPLAETWMAGTSVAHMLAMAYDEPTMDAVCMRLWTHKRLKIGEEWGESGQVIFARPVVAE
ncbi:MAG: hypothetical protein WCJ35_01695 [Planctomycetota bacterium]